MKRKGKINLTIFFCESVLDVSKKLMYEFCFIMFDFYKDIIVDIESLINFL